MLAAAAWPLWAHTMTTMPGGGGSGESLALRLAEPYKLKLAINKSAVCLAPVAVAEQQKFSANTTLRLSSLTSATRPMCCWRLSRPARPMPASGMALRWLKRWAGV